MTDAPAARATGAKWRSVRGERNIFRSPFKQGGRWRFRMVDIHTGKIITASLAVSGSPRKPGTISRPSATPTEARQAVAELAEAERRKADEAQRDPHKLEPRESTLRLALTEWLATFIDGRRPSTAFDLRACCDLYCSTWGDDAPVRSVDYGMVELFLTEGSRAGRTRIKHLSNLRRFFRWATKQRYRTDNPAALIVDEAESYVADWRKDVRRARLTGKALTREECIALLTAARSPYKVVCKGRRNDPTAAGKERPEQSWVQEHAPPPYLFPALMLMLQSGLRLGNCVGPRSIEWRDLDLEAGTVTIDRDRMKSDWSDYSAPLHAEAVAALREWRRSQKRVPLQGDKVFPVVGKRPRKGEEPAARQLIASAWRSTLKRAGLEAKRFRVHDLRHSYRTALGAVAPVDVCNLMLHHSPTETSARYAHPTLEQARKYIEMLPWLLPARSATHPVALRDAAR